jgi:hypothetical protein
MNALLEAMCILIIEQIDGYPILTSVADVQIYIECRPSCYKRH